MYDIKNRRTFLKKVKVPSVKVDDLYLGATITVFSRQLKVVEYGDNFTESTFEQARQAGGLARTSTPPTLNFLLRLRLFLLLLLRLVQRRFQRRGRRRRERSGGRGERGGAAVGVPHELHAGVLERVHVCKRGEEAVGCGGAREK